MGSDESHFNVSLIVRGKVTRQCPQATMIVRDKVTRQCPQTTVIVRDKVTRQCPQTTIIVRDKVTRQCPQTTIIVVDGPRPPRSFEGSDCADESLTLSPLATLSPSLISLTVSVDVKQHVYHYYDSNALGVICAGISIGRVREKRGL